MIVKVVVREKDCSVWDKEGNRLYFSDVEKDVKFAAGLLDQYKTPYFAAMWLKGIVSIKKPVTGYNF